MSILGLLVATASLPAHAIAQAAPPTANLAIPGAKERQAIRYDLISKRLDTVLLGAMRRNDIDAWLTFSREANLDPMLSEIGGGWGGVRNAYIFFDRGDDKPEKVFIGSHQLRDQTIPAIYDEHIYYGYTPEGIRPHLRRVMEERDPQRIGINVSPTLPMGTDWLSKRSERWTSGARRGKPSTSYRRGSGFWRSPERSSSSYSS